jgi:hypothetical protein
MRDTMSAGTKWGMMTGLKEGHSTRPVSFFSYLGGLEGGDGADKTRGIS